MNTLHVNTLHFNKYFHFKVYEDGVFTLSMNCAREAAQHGVKYFIEISSAELCSKDEVGIQ